MDEMKPPTEGHSIVTSDAWRALRTQTPARVAIGRAGGSLPTSEWLNFKSSHAAARDAVHAPFDAERLAGEIAALGTPTVVLATAAADKGSYLRHPDRGRKPDAASREKLQSLIAAETKYDLSIVVSDGLSAFAAERQVVPLLTILLPKLAADGWQLAPIAVVRFGRVALQDEVGSLARVKISLMLLGERPGLGTPDSLGAYLVYGPKGGNTDADRNCVSNIHPQGLSFAAAADTLHYLLTEASRRRLSGIGLKDERMLAAASIAADDRRLPSE
jgi:ethanolamine ammonia-lyase small subunit